MRTIIAGSRTASKEQTFVGVQSCPWKAQISLVVSGTAIGADTFGEQWAESNNIPIQRYKPDWKKYGKRAGFVRNRIMAENADALILIWNGTSRGSEHMLFEATELGLKIYVYRI